MKFLKPRLMLGVVIVAVGLTSGGAATATADVSAMSQQVKPASLKSEITALCDQKLPPYPLQQRRVSVSYGMACTGRKPWKQLAYDVYESTAIVVIGDTKDDGYKVGARWSIEGSKPKTFAVVGDLPENRSYSTWDMTISLNACESIVITFVRAGGPKTFLANFHAPCPGIPA